MAPEKKMAPKKSVRKKNSPQKTKKRSRKKSSLKIQLVKICMGFCLLLVLVVSASIAVHFMLLQKEKTASVVYEKPRRIENLKQEKTKTPESLKQKIIDSGQKPVPISPEKKPILPQEKKPDPENDIVMAKIPEFKKPTVYEIYPEKDFVIPKPDKKKSVDDYSKDRPKVAIIIDDLGYDPYIARRLIELEPNFTFSIIPHSPFQKKIADLIREKGGELMLHLPMEPNEYPEIDPGPGALLSSMEPDKLIAQLNDNLDTMSDIKGVNGHMGSKLTANSEQMYQVFTILKRRNLYFVDSLTTAQSVCKPSAKLLKVPFAQRDIFIDHFHDPEFMKSQIRQLIKRAKTQGEAIGIAHPHKETLRILENLLPELRKQVDIVPASQLVK